MAWSILGIAALCAAVWLIAEYGSGDTNESKIDESFEDVEVGDCYANPGIGNQYNLDVVDCSNPRAVRVVAIVELALVGPFPGLDAMDAQTAARCPETTTSSLVPTQNTWNVKGARRIICLEDA